MVAVRLNPLIIVLAMLGVGAVASVGAVRGSMGLAADDSWQLALIHAEFALAALLFLPAGGGRRCALENLANAAACFAAAGACVLLFSFSSAQGAGWQTRGLSAGAWLFATGWLSLAARGSRVWMARARVGVLSVFALPPLWHYLLLEYAGAGATHLRPLSPNWALAGDDITLWPLLVLGALPWAVAVALPAGRDK